MIKIDALKEVIGRFDRDLKDGLVMDDPETDTERLYIEPFLAALGWDIRSREVRKNRTVSTGNKIKTFYKTLILAK